MAIILISAGTYLFVKPAFESIHLQWVFSSTIIIVGLFFAIFGGFLKPNKVKVNKTSQKAEEKGAAPSVEKPQGSINGSETKAIEEGKVNIKLGSANAMTKTASYDAIAEEKPASAEAPKK